MAVAEPRPFHRNVVRDRFRLADDHLFEDWRQLIARPRLADIAIVATQDADHVEPAIALAELGYHLLLEKPMATSARDCLRIVEAVKRAHVLLCVCHVLRYTPYTSKLVEILRSGALGEIVSIVHLEPIGSWHFAHSYVRGNWSVHLPLDDPDVKTIIVVLMYHGLSQAS